MSGTDGAKAPSAGAVVDQSPISVLKARLEWLQYMVAVPLRYMTDTDRLVYMRDMIALWAKSDNQGGPTGSPKGVAPGISEGGVDDR
jgi:hypothetical protein